MATANHTVYVLSGSQSLNIKSIFLYKCAGASAVSVQQWTRASSLAAKHPAQYCRTAMGGQYKQQATKESLLSAAMQSCILHEKQDVLASICLVER